MLTAVEVINERGSNLLLPLGDTSAGYLVTDVEGLGPVKASLSTSSFASIAGAQYQSGRREVRNIVIGLEFDPDYVTTTVSGLRSNLYSYFMPLSPIDLLFHRDDEPTLKTSGIVESMEAVIFSREPSVSISILCPDPDMSTGDTLEARGTTVPTVTDAYSHIDYVGTISVGFHLTLLITHAVPEIVVRGTNPKGRVETITLTLPFIDGDILVVDTRVRQKSATLIRDGVETSVLHAVSPLSKWFDLDPGNNDFLVSAAGSPMPYTLVASPRYGGI